MVKKYQVAKIVAGNENSTIKRMFTPGSLGLEDVDTGLSRMQISPEEPMEVFMRQAAPRRHLSPNRNVPAAQPAIFKPSQPAPVSFQPVQANKSRVQSVNIGYNPNVFFGTYGIDVEAPGFVGSIEDLTLDNNTFRTVLHTTNRSQLVVMALNPGEDIGMETHRDSDQFFRIETGTGVIIIDGVQRLYKDGTAIVVPAGSKHNVIARTETKLYTVYSPPQHEYDVIDVTKSDAMMREHEG
jgi:mannose-6-phosphate isomerase-like protein (cupin superfamily)